MSRCERPILLYRIILDYDNCSISAHLLARGLSKENQAQDHDKCKFFSLFIVFYSNLLTVLNVISCNNYNSNECEGGHPGMYPCSQVHAELSNRISKCFSVNRGLLVNSYGLTTPTLPTLLIWDQGHVSKHNFFTCYENIYIHIGLDSERLTAAYQ